MTTSEFPEHAIDVRRVVKRFRKVTAVDGIDLCVAPGRVLALLGPNGAGKTTVIRLLATLLRPDAGRARVAGFDVEGEPAAVRRRIALSGQHTSVDEELSGRANLVLLGRLLDLGRRDARLRAEDLLDRFGLGEAADRPASGYSGGMRRRLDLAAALMGRPQVVFLDEPSVGLDPGKRDELWGMVRGLRDEGVTVLLTTQYLEEADALADVVTVIDRGRVIATGTPAELKARVGGHTVVLRPADPSDLDAAAEIMAAAVGHRPQRSPRHELVVPVGGHAELVAMVTALHGRGVGIDEVALRLPGLDEVFRALIGTPGEDAA